MKRFEKCCYYTVLQSRLFNFGQVMMADFQVKSMGRLKVGLKLNLDRKPLPIEMDMK